MHSYSFQSNDYSFRYWLCAATGPTIKIWDLESKNMVEELRPEVKHCEQYFGVDIYMMID